MTRKKFPDRINNLGPKSVRRDYPLSVLYAHSHLLSEKVKKFHTSVAVVIAYVSVQSIEGTLESGLGKHNSEMKVILTPLDILNLMRRWHKSNTNPCPEVRLAAAVYRNSNHWPSQSLHCRLPHPEHPHPHNGRAQLSSNGFRLHSVQVPVS